MLTMVQETKQAAEQHFRCFGRLRLKALALTSGMVLHMRYWPPITVTYRHM